MAKKLDTNLIKDTAHFSRAEIPDVVKRLQARVKEWLDTMPVALAKRIRTRLPKIGDIPVEVLGAIDEEQAIYKDLKSSLIKVQCFLDMKILPEDTPLHPYEQLSVDMGMLLVVVVLQDIQWLIKVYAETLRKEMTPKAAREFVDAEFVKLVKRQEWLNDGA